MNECNDHEGLLLIIGELLYKNQLLREAMASKDEALALIHVDCLKAATSTCSCGIGGHCRSFDIWYGFEGKNLRIAEDVALVRLERSTDIHTSQPTEYD